VTRGLSSRVCSRRPQSRRWAAAAETQHVMPHPDMVILFDVDGTLIDHDQAETVAVAALHRRLGHPGPVGDFYDQWRNALERHYAR
jgi:hypothetical protein